MIHQHRPRSLRICLGWSILLITLIACRSDTAVPAVDTETTAVSTPVPTEVGTIPSGGVTAVVTEAVATNAVPTSAILAYQNPDLPTAERVDDLLARMTLAEKIGQMTLVEKNSINPDDIAPLGIGALLSGGGGYPADNTPAGWREMVTGFQERALQSRLGIPLLYGVDAIHGHNNVRGTVIFPHNVGLGAARDAELVADIARVTALETAATGIFWNYAPVVAVPQDIRWGRTYEGYSENTALVSELGTAYLRGLQGDDLSAADTMLATPKHFVGDGGTAFGSSEQFIIKQFLLDQGVTDVDEATLRAVHLPPYEAAVDAGARSIMVSFSSWGGKKMHAQRYLLTDVLKGELGFTGFVVSDWQGIDQISGDYDEAVVTAINAGIDVNMVPYDYQRFIAALADAVEHGDVAEARIDDAVRRILTVKFELGLWERPFADPDLLQQVGSPPHRALARRAVAQSLVLLKNDEETLPLDKATPLIFVAGEAADDLGIQSGGWTIEWQGQAGAITEGTTVLEGIESAVSPDTRIHYNRFGNFERVTDEAGNTAVADVGIVIVGEQPYAEGVGDSDNLTLSEADLNAIAKTRVQSEKLVVVLVSGRPLIVTEHLPEWDALVAAWLPGSEGAGVADVLFGDHPFTGKLPYTWPRHMNQLPFDFTALAADGPEAPRFPYGYGLTTK